MKQEMKKKRCGGKEEKKYKEESLWEERKEGGMPMALEDAATAVLRLGLRQAFVSQEYLWFPCLLFHPYAEKAYFPLRMRKGRWYFSAYA